MRRQQTIVKFIYLHALIISLFGIKECSATGNAITSAPATSAAAPAAVCVPSFADTVQKILPAVVEISTERGLLVHKRGGHQDLERLLDSPEITASPLGNLLKEMIEGGRGIEDPKNKHYALGSGFIVDPKGYIVTNCHVIQGADAVKVSLNDGRVLDAKIIARDKRTDLALLKVESADALPALKWGDSNNARVGDWVLAVGSPFGFGRSVSAGIISARARDLSASTSSFEMSDAGIMAGYVDDLIQTDAAINMGNSGGPMVNVQGEIIGVNVAIFSPSGGSVGIGFAVPSLVASKSIDEMIKKGRVQYGWIGVQVGEVTDEFSKKFGFSEEKKKGINGALIAQVLPKGPAQKAGLQVSDIILSFDGKPIKNYEKLSRLVGEATIGKQVVVEVWRKEKRQNITLTVEELMDDEKEDAPASHAVSPSSDVISIPLQPEKGDKAKTQTYIGLTLAPVTEDLRKQFKLKESITGLLVLGLDRYAQSTGNMGSLHFQNVDIELDDILEEVDKKKLSSVKDIESALNEAQKTKKEKIVFKVLRQGNSHYVAIALGHEAQVPKPSREPDKETPKSEEKK